MYVAGSESQPKLLIKAAVTGRAEMTSPCDVTSSSLTELDVTSELGVQLAVGRRLKHIAMKATFDQPRHSRDGSQAAASAALERGEFYASELLGSFIVDQQQQQLLQQPATVLQVTEVKKTLIRFFLRLSRV